MRYYVEFMDEIAPGNFWRSCGDRGVAIINGRLTAKDAHKIANAEMKKRGFDKYWITKANSLREVEGSK